MLLRELLSLLEKMREAFPQQRVFERVFRQALGLLCTVGRRTVARVLAATGRDQQAWSSDYRVFSRSPWESQELFVPILQETLKHCPGEGPIVMAADFTHLKKSGKHIPHATWIRDPMSPPFHVNLIMGLRFFQATVLCGFRNHQPDPLPARSIPVCFEPSPMTKKPGKKASPGEVAAYKKALREKPAAKAARANLQTLRGNFDQAGAAARPLLITLDGSFCNRVFLGEALDRTALICRCRKDAQLCFQAPREKGSRRFYAPEKFTPEAVRKDSSIEWNTADFFLGGCFRALRYKEIQRVLWQGGARRRFLRLIVIAPTGYRLHRKGRLLYRDPAYLLTDDLETPAAELIAAYLEHWQIEVNHREEKTTLGLGDAQVRNERSVPRQPALVVACYAMLNLASLNAYGPERTDDYLPQPKWARATKRPSCQDMIALLRHQLDAEPQIAAKYGVHINTLDLLTKAAA
jgi:hypothetical protein